MSQFQNLVTASRQSAAILEFQAEQVRRSAETPLRRWVLKPVATSTHFKRNLAAGLVLLTIAIATFRVRAAQTTPPERAQPNAIIRPQDMADALRAVIAAEREVYTKVVVQRLVHDEKTIKTSEHWEQDKALPTPCQDLRLGAEAIQTKGAEFSYTLRALRPINPRNAPETAVERLGLEAVARHPETNYYGNETLGGRRYLTAVYADKAISRACVACHNEHPKSAKNDWKLDDVIGGLVVRIPLEF
ncbi:MAG: DUF3365 domain-containing protein [Verrucomicrobia bacterium]|nr:DUF3365 domain-containing protein [Verrucomicrobiota bacterium]